MDDLSKTIANGFIGSFRDFAQRVHGLSDKLTEEQFWTRPYPYGNSFGHLMSHLIGNLNYYIGAGIAQTEYVRDRDREFLEATPPAKEEILRQFDEVLELVVATLESQSADDWTKHYTATGVLDFVKDRFSIFLRCATHFHHHVGQMIYLEMELSRKETNFSERSA